MGVPLMPTWQPDAEGGGWVALVRTHLRTFGWAGLGAPFPKKIEKVRPVHFWKSWLAGAQWGGVEGAIQRYLEAPLLTKMGQFEQRGHF